MKRILNNNNGAALAMVIMVMVVLVILGTSALSIGLAEAKFSIRSENNLQAEYIAKAGADVTADYIIANPSATITGKSGNLGNGEFDVDISGAKTEKVTIQSTGRVNDLSRTVTLILEREPIDYTMIFDGIRQTGETDLDLEAIDISYDEGDTVTIRANVDNIDQILLSIENEKDENIKQIAKKEEIPEAAVPPLDLEYIADLPGDNVFQGNYWIETSKKYNNENITFNTGSEDIHVVFEKGVEIKGDIFIEGAGAVHLYLLDNSVMQTPIKVNEAGAGPLFIYVAKNKDLDLAANGEMNAYIYGPESKIIMQSSKTTLNGAIVGNVVTGKGGANSGNFHFVPLSKNPEDTVIDGGMYIKKNYQK